MLRASEGLCAWRFRNPALLNFLRACERHKPARTSYLASKPLTDHQRVACSPEIYLKDLEVRVKEADYSNLFQSFIEDSGKAKELQSCPRFKQKEHEDSTRNFFSML